MFFKIMVFMACLQQVAGFTFLLLFCIVGASSDFDGATKIAKMMVTRFGMSDKVTVSKTVRLNMWSEERISHERFISGAFSVCAAFMVLQSVLYNMHAFLLICKLAYSC